MTFRILPRTFLAVAICFLGGTLLGQPPGGPQLSATLTFADGKSTTIRASNKRVFDSVKVLPDEALDIRLRLPPNFVNTNVILQADRGRVSDKITIAGDGSTAFVFQANGGPGPYRVELRTFESSILLQFFVPKPASP